MCEISFGGATSDSPRTGALGVLCCAVVLLLAPFQAWSLESDQDQPIHIESDTLSIDERKEVAVYRGNVTLDQGSIRIQADMLSIYGFKDKTDKIVATGNPVTFRQRPDNAAEDIRGQAQQVEYHIDSDKVYLLRQAKLWRQQDTFSNDHIEYDRRNALIKTLGKGRVKMVIQPKKKP